MGLPRGQEGSLGYDTTRGNQVDRSKEEKRKSVIKKTGKETRKEGR